MHNLKILISATLLALAGAASAQATAPADANKEDYSLVAPIPANTAQVDPDASDKAGTAAAAHPQEGQKDDAQAAPVEDKEQSEIAPQDRPDTPSQVLDKLTLTPPPVIPDCLQCLQPTNTLANVMAAIGYAALSPADGIGQLLRIVLNSNATTQGK